MDDQRKTEHMRWSVNTWMNILRRSLSKRTIINTKTVSQSPSSLVVLLFSLFSDLDTTFPQTDAIFARISSLLRSTILLNIHLTLSDKLCWNKTNNCALKENYSPSAKVKLQRTSAIPSLWFTISEFLTSLINSITLVLKLHEKNKEDLVSGAIICGIINTVIWRSVLSRSWHS